MTQIEDLVSLPNVRINGKQRNGDGYYTAFRCDVEQMHLMDVLTEYLAFIENKSTLSFELLVHDADAYQDNAPSSADHDSPDHR